MSSKAALKSAKAALDAGDYDKAIQDAQTVLSGDAKNYFARLFLGRAYEKQGKFDDAAKSYDAAAKSKPDDSQAWLGLCSVFEAQGSKRVDEYRESAVKAAEIFRKAEDGHRCQTTIDKLTSFSKQYGTKRQYRKALEVLLPEGPVYDFLEGRIQQPFITYSRIAEIVEDEEARFIKQEIAARRTRIGAKLGQVTADVKREVFAQSDLEYLYQEIINWSMDDEVRREVEEKLLQRAYESLTCSTIEEKGTKLDQVLSLAEGMVVIHHPFQLAWDLVLESRDLDDLRGLDVNVLREYTSLFADSGFSKILQAWLNSELSPFPPSRESNANSEDQKKLSPEDRLLLMTDGLAMVEESPLAHRLACDYYLHLEEYESAADVARAGLRATITESRKLGLSMQNTKDAINSVLASALVHYQSPRNHPEARRLFESVLQRKPAWTPALIGLGLIFEEREEYDNAIDFFSRALIEDADNVPVGAELAWCRALNGDYAQGRNELETYLPKMNADNPRARDLKAQMLYRIGICTWELDTSKTSRRSRSGAYSSFLAAIKSNVNFAPPYTYLGLYYEDYGKDKKRARQCFQKAFELSPAETDAAERLARSYAEQGDWDIVEVIAQRVIDTGRARPPPGSKRKGLSWPYSALGVVQMNKQEYQTAITSFLAALRISPDDYSSYVGLGESYHNSGRYNSALRTFNYALDPHDGLKMRISGETWFAKYMLANVHRELGEYEEAITGLQAVLKLRPEEFGVLMSLLQTYVERSWRCVELGLFGQAVSTASEAIITARKIAKSRPGAFNMWKAVGDASLIFSWVQSRLDELPVAELFELLSTAAEHSTYNDLADVDHVTLSTIHDSENEEPTLAYSINAGILAYKRAIHSCSHDVHAQAVAWYNLGWAEHRAYTCNEAKPGRKYLRAAVRCFKRAIELEAGNAEFWNALGVVTTTLNPKVAQHSFVRSLHLNELNAKVWTNLGVLYFLQNDQELAHQAFRRAQSTDPDYAHAWLGEGLIALLLGNKKEALSHFTHAFEISDSLSIMTKRQYALSVFDHLLSTPSASNDLTSLIQPIFALEQLQRQKLNDLPYQQLAALFSERVGNHAAAIDVLTSLCTAAEAEYEVSESLASLERFANAKSDLARNQLAGDKFADAIENAETALSVITDTENKHGDAEFRAKLRLSTYLTAGIASHYLERNSEAIAMFKSALQESDSDPEVICSLVKVLCAYGGDDEKAVAREQLFGAVEKHPEHVNTLTLLGTIAALDDDIDTMNAVKDDLITLRTKETLTLAQEEQIERLLYSITSLSTNGDSMDATTAGVQAAIVLKPELAQVWSDLLHLSSDTYTASMALEMSQKSVPPGGDVASDELAKAFAAVGTVADAQRSICLAPWGTDGWQSLESAISQ